MWHRRLSLVLITLTLFAGSIRELRSQTNEQDLDYILRRYIQANGGRGPLEQVSSVRMRGRMISPDGSTQAVTVMKKKPNLVRITADTGIYRVIKAYNGETAWYSRESGRFSEVKRLKAEQAVDLIRDAPLAGVLFNSKGRDVSMTLDGVVPYESWTCYQISATYPDMSKFVHFIDQESFMERCILQYDSKGILVAEIIPTEFEKIDGILFSTRIDRYLNGKLQGTLVLEEIETNIGIIDEAFDPPAQLQDN